MTNSQKITRVIDPIPADDGRYRTQDEWIEFFNEERKAMMSGHDVYRAPDSVLQSFREDFRTNYGLITNTSISYNPNDLKARIIQDFGSTIVTPKETSLVVPVYRDEQVEKVAKGEGLKYLQTLFDTEDDASKLIGRLEEISEKEAKDILIWTPDETGRGEQSKRAVDFGFYHGRFRVGGGWCDYGRARGVSVKSA
ncbi:MAG: hypothetical protein Q8R00_04025 [Candidatus Nanoarchaeia archaeon]|nr:hypothetical protein [Candidatus Nanoarchaeia archaeon]